MNIFDSNNNIIRKRLKPKNDLYKKDRGGSSEFLDLYCSSCNTYIGTYQKDGPGNLFRLYVDRLTTPYDKFEGSFENLNEMPVLRCVNPKCNQEIGVPMIYEKEKRLAYRIISSIRKRKNFSGKFLPNDIVLEDLFLEQ